MMENAMTGPVLITGGAGFLGTNIAAALARRGQDVLILDNLNREHVERNLAWLKDSFGDRIRVKVADVRDANAVADAVTNAAGVIHLAAQVAVTTSVLHPADDFEINARGTLNVLEAVRTLAPDIPVLFASTNKVYGKLLDFHELVLDGMRHIPADRKLRFGFDERTPLSFYSPYGCSKGAADQYVLDYARIYGLKTAVFRMSCLYGPHQFGHEDQGWVAHFVISALAGKPLTIYGDGCQMRDVLYVDDAVRAWLMALDRPADFAGRAFNLGGGPGNAISLLDLIAHIEEMTGRRMEYIFDAWRPGDQAWYVSDTRALEAATGWTPTVSVEDGLRRLADWLMSEGIGEPERARRSA
jgi:CDP-paratose 2-epimerase